jgi:hypothetical protein
MMPTCNPDTESMWTIPAVAHRSRISGDMPRMSASTSARTSGASEPKSRSTDRPAAARSRAVHGGGATTRTAAARIISDPLSLVAVTWPEAATSAPLGAVPLATNSETGAPQGVIPRENAPGDSESLTRATSTAPDETRLTHASFDSAEAAAATAPAASIAPAAAIRGDEARNAAIAIAPATNAANKPAFVNPISNPPRYAPTSHAMRGMVLI